MFNFSLDKKAKSNDFDLIKKWDLIIVGGGPAGLNAALYAKRKGLVVGMIVDDIGGQLHNTSMVDNYLGFKMVGGSDLSDAFFDHLEELQVPMLQAKRVTEITHLDPDFSLTISNGTKYLTKTVLISTGGVSRKLSIPGEDTFANKGVTYCATCDGPFFKDKHVIVAGGGNSAAEGVLDLVPWASKITVVHRSDWRADEILLKKLSQIEKLDVHLQTQIVSVIGDEIMTGIEVLDKSTNKKRRIQADGLLIEIGLIPNSFLVEKLVKLNERKEIIVDKNQMTSLRGLYAAGDVTEQPFKQIIISAAEGAKAALSINQYLNQNYKEKE